MSDHLPRSAQTTAKEDAARHAVEVRCPPVDQYRVGAELTRFGTGQMAERLRQQGALQQRENELLRAQLAREADLSKAEGRWAAKLEQQERRHKKEIAEHARQRELREQERERERQAARDEIAAAKELKVRLAWLTSLAALTRIGLTVGARAAERAAGED